MTTETGEPARDAPGGLPPAQRALAMLTVCLGVVLTSIDSVIANIALPAITNDLDVSAAATIWVVTSYQLAVTVCILPLASLGERMGYRRVYLAGLVIFTLASLGCATSDTLPMLVGFRALQGVGGACLVSVALALVRFIYPRERIGRGFGLYATMVASSMAAGPAVASLILSLAHWPWLFAVNVPTGIASLAVGLRALPATARSGTRPDLLATLLNAVGLGLTVIGIDGLGLASTRPRALTELAVGVAALIGLVLRERRRPRPLLPVDLLAIRLFGLSSLTAVMSYAAALMAFVALPFFLQTITAASDAEVGLLITPWPLGIVAGAQLTGRLSDRYPAGILASAGLLVLASGATCLALLPAAATTADIVWRMALCGLGFGFFQTPNNRTLMTAGPPERSGAASGMLATCRLLGMSLGAAAAAVLFSAAPAEAPRMAMWVTAAIALGAGTVSVTRLRG